MVCFIKKIFNYTLLFICHGKGFHPFFYWKKSSTVLFTNTSHKNQLSSILSPSRGAGYLKQRFLLVIVYRYIDYYIKKIKSQMNYSDFFLPLSAFQREILEKKFNRCKKICPLIGVSVNCLSAFWNVFYEDLT